MRFKIWQGVIILGAAVVLVVAGFTKQQVELGYVYEPKAIEPGQTTLVDMKVVEAPSPKTSEDTMPEPISGLMFRDQNHAKSDKWLPLIGGGVVRAQWENLESSPNVYNFEQIASAIDKYKSLGITKLHLRLYGGVWSPQWLKDDVGAMPWRNNNKSIDKDHTLPNMWGTKYAERWRLLNEAIAEEFGDEFSQVQVSGAGTVYAEPFIRQLSDNLSVVALNKWGVTKSVDEELQRAIFQSTEEVWDGIAYRVLSVFTWQYIQNGKPVWGDAQSAYELVEEFTMVNPDLILMANDLRENPGEARLALHEWLASQQNRLVFQTAAASRVGDPWTMFDFGVSYGAHAIELPGTFREWDFERTKDYADIFAAPRTTAF